MRQSFVEMLTPETRERMEKLNEVVIMLERLGWTNTNRPGRGLHLRRDDEELTVRMLDAGWSVAYRPTFRDKFSVVEVSDVSGVRHWGRVRK